MSEGTDRIGSDSPFVAICRDYAAGDDEPAYRELLVNPLPRAIFDVAIETNGATSSGIAGFALEARAWKAIGLRSRDELLAGDVAWRVSYRTADGRFATARHTVPPSEAAADDAEIVAIVERRGIVAVEASP